MKVIKNRILGILLSFMLVLGSISGMSLPVYASEIPYGMTIELFGIMFKWDYANNIYLVGRNVYQGEPMSGDGWTFDGNTLSGDGWEFEPGTCTFTMNSLKYTGSKTAINYQEGSKVLEIELKGDNSITSTGSCGITSNEIIDIKGSGSLSVTSTGRCGIEAYKGIVINSPASLSVTSSDNDTCLHAKENLWVRGGKVSVTGTNINSAISCDALTVDSGELTAIVPERSSGTAIGIDANGSVIVNSGGTLTAISGGTATGSSYGLDVDGKITVDGGTVNVMAGSAPRSSSYGIRSTSSLKIIGGTLIASAGDAKQSSYGINSTNVIVGSRIQYVESSGQTRAIYSPLLETQVNATGWTDYEGTTGDELLPGGSYNGYDHFGTGVIKRKIQFPDVVKLPVFSPPGGTYNAEQSVTISCGTEGADIYYTTDGTDPSPENGQKYTEAFTVTIPSTIKAIAVKSGMTDSAIVTAEYKAPVITTVTINTKTVSATSLDAAVAKAGASRDTVKTIVLGKNVSKIRKGAFVQYMKAKTMVVKTKKLKKSSVRNSLKGSQITKVKVQVGTAKTNKSYVKKYKKIFTKKNSGKTVKVSL